jgi:hypothetical protein
MVPVVPVTFFYSTSAKIFAHEVCVLRLQLEG